MRPPVRTLLACAALLAASLWWWPPGAARAAQDNGAFRQELKADNAPHLAEAPKLKQTSRPPTVERDWEEKITRKSWELTQGPLSVSVTLKKGGPPDGMMFLSPVLSLSVEGKEAISVEGADSFPDNPIFLVQIAEMDPGNRYAEVVFSTYTGGAHCCSDTYVLTSSKDGSSWSSIELGTFDGGPLETRDIDGDGRYELAMRDNSFLYAFGCYACSTAPLQVLRLEDGEFGDVSTDDSFRPSQVESLRSMIEWAEGDVDRNGFLAGYVGQKILLGEGAQAWKFMLRHHDADNEWGRETCTVKEDDQGECPKGKKALLSYPDALERFLREAGYELEK